MKYNYTTPQSEILATMLSYCILQDSLIDNYSGEDATAADGQW
jgi:hypothetical protein